MRERPCLPSDAFGLAIEGRPIVYCPEDDKQLQPHHLLLEQDN
jgi:hypothetical protein